MGGDGRRAASRLGNVLASFGLATLVLASLGHYRAAPIEPSTPESPEALSPASAGHDAGGAHALDVQTVMRNYEISGRSAAELSAAIRERGPSFAGRRHWAVTRWNVSWRYHYAPGSPCRIKSSETRLGIAFEYPRWVDRHRADDSLGDAWDRMLAGLTAHEEAHADHGRGAAREVQALLGEAGGAPTCDELGRELNRRAGEIVSAYAERDRVLDRETSHGATTIPPLEARAMVGRR